MWGVRNAHPVNRNVLQRPLRGLPSRVGCEKCPPRESGCRGQRLFQVLSAVIPGFQGDDCDFGTDANAGREDGLAEARVDIQILLRGFLRHFS